jgi:tRNA(fMet)-specific endonuclease VapC
VFLLDTDTCIDVLRGRRNSVLKLQSLSPDDCAVSSITAFELYAGTLISLHPARERLKVEQFLDQLSVIAFDQVAAQYAASIRAELQRSGSTIGAYDLLIVAEAMRSGTILVSSNQREFRKIPNLRHESWRAGSVRARTGRTKIPRKVTKPQRREEE